MSIVVECPSCGNRGPVPDSYAGRLVRCPKCTHSFTIGAHAKAAPPAPAAKAPPVAAEPSSPQEPAAEDEVIDDVSVVEDEPKPVRTPQERYGFRDEPKAEPAAKKPRPRQRPEEDEDYEEEAREVSRPTVRRRRPAAAGPQWQKGRVGLLLVFIAACILASSFGLQQILNLIVKVFTVSPNGLQAIFTILKFIQVLAFGQAIVALVGYVFCLMVPNRHGTLGLGIAMVSLGGVNLLTRLQFQLIPVLRPGGGIGVGGVLFEAFGLSGGLFGSFGFALAAATFIELLYAAEIIVVATYLRSVALSFKDYGGAQNAMVVVVLGSVHAGIRVLANLIFYIVWETTRSSRTLPGKGMHYFFEALYWAAAIVFLVELVFLAVSVFNTRAAIDVDDEYQQDEPTEGAARSPRRRRNRERRTFKAAYIDEPGDAWLTRNRIMGGIGVFWGIGVLIYGLSQSTGGGAYGAGAIAGIGMGGLLLTGGLLYIIRG
jgi:hypothetical protein